MGVVSGRKKMSVGGKDEGQKCVHRQKQKTWHKRANGTNKSSAKYTTLQRKEEHGNVSAAPATAQTQTCMKKRGGEMLRKV